MTSLVKLIKKFSSRKEGIFKYAIDARGRKTPPWAKKEVWIWGIAALSILAVLIALSSFKPDDTKTTSTKTDSRGNILEITTTTIPQDAKNVWDWMGLLGVPLTLALLGYFLQQLQQASVESSQREEALQNYLDRLSDLLIDKNVIALATKVHRETGEEKLLAAASDVIRARTVSLLRRLGNDGERKGHILTFLIASEVIGKLRLHVKDFDFSGANLEGANLTGASLSGGKFSSGSFSGAGLEGANLSGADFSGANFKEANLIETDLKSVNFSGANLEGSNLYKANLEGANLAGANLTETGPIEANFRGANLKGANLNRAALNSANLSNTDLTCADFSNADLSETNLEGARITHVCFSSTNLTGANLTGARGWTEKQLGKAKLFETKLPEGCKLSPYRGNEI